MSNTAEDLKKQLEACQACDKDLAALSFKDVAEAVVHAAGALKKIDAKSAVLKSSGKLLAEHASFIQGMSKEAQKGGIAVTESRAALKRKISELETAIKNAGS